MNPETPNWVIHPGNMNEAADLFALQKKAFQAEARLYDDPKHPALTQTLGELIAEYRQKAFLSAWMDGSIVGSIRGFMQKDACYISRLMVDPDSQGQGIGSALMQRIEKQFPMAERFEISTGDRNRWDIRFYKRLGYKILKTELVSKKLTLVYLEKKKIV
jgi:ribosomal protein S18 acetylase RimI-like enzyme